MAAVAPAAGALPVLRRQILPTKVMTPLRVNFSNVLCRKTAVWPGMAVARTQRAGPRIQSSPGGNNDREGPCGKRRSAAVWAVEGPKAPLGATFARLFYNGMFIIIFSVLMAALLLCSAYSIQVH